MLFPDPMLGVQSSHFDTALSTAASSAPRAAAASSVEAEAEAAAEATVEAAAEASPLPPPLPPSLPRPVLRRQVHVPPVTFVAHSLPRTSSNATSNRTWSPRISPATTWSR